MIHAKLRHIIESNSSEEGVSSCSSVAGDEIHDSGVPGSFSWFRSEGRQGYTIPCACLAIKQTRITILLPVNGVELGPQLGSCLKGPISTPSYKENQG